jgi:PAS domain S-box-containing protein
MHAMYERFIWYGLLAFVVIALSMLLALLLLRRLQQSITGPILELAKTAETISVRGDYAVRAAASDGYEANLLTHAFNHMLEQIEVQNREIISFNQQLEEKIRLRTGELEQTNEVLKQQNEFVETIIDSSVDLIAVFDRHLNYVTINRQSYEAYHLNADMIIGKNVTAIFPEAVTAGMVADLNRALKGEAVHNPRYKSIVLNRYFENFYIPLKDPSGSVYRILTIAHDITAIMETNEKLLALNAELQKSNQNLEQFAYIASHDLQEPLRKIQTFSQLAGKNLQHPEILKRYLEKINASAARMSDLVRAVLNYSRLSSADQVYENADLNEITSNVLTDLELVIAEKKAVIQSGNLPVIRGIPLQLSQLFLNLISNSIKFSDRPPVITISAAELSLQQQHALQLKQPGRWVAVLFSDNGIGFEQQYADKIFTIFQRLQNSKDYAGTGIGLSLSKKIVENHYGKITVVSQPGHGSTFTVYLPMDEHPV